MKTNVQISYLTQLILWLSSLIIPSKVY